MINIIQLKIILILPTPNVLYGLQKGSGTNYETVQKQLSTKDKNLAFEFTIETRIKDDTVDYYGPFVQGPKNQRFVYINIGTSAGDFVSPWTRRLKVPLTGIIPQNTNYTTSVPGTDKHGNPNCATVKPFVSWIIDEKI